MKILPINVLMIINFEREKNETHCVEFFHSEQPIFGARCNLHQSSLPIDVGVAILL